MSVVLWEEDAQSGVIVELEEQRRKNFRSFEALRSAATVGEIRAADLAPWARSIVDSHLEDLAWDHENEGDELATVSDDEPWNYGDVAELVMEAAPLPHDALVAAAGWGPSSCGSTPRSAAHRPGATSTSTQSLTRTRSWPRSRNVVTRCGATLA